MWQTKINYENKFKIKKILTNKIKKKKRKWKKKKREMEMKGKIKGKKSICITIYMNSIMSEVAFQSFCWKKNCGKKKQNKKKKEKTKKSKIGFYLFEINLVFNLVFLL
jgi:hypothetical protein